MLWYDISLALGGVCQRAPYMLKYSFSYLLETGRFVHGSFRCYSSIFLIVHRTLISLVLIVFVALFWGVCGFNGCYLREYLGHYCVSVGLRQPRIFMGLWIVSSSNNWCVSCLSRGW